MSTVIKAGAPTPARTVPAPLNLTDHLVEAMASVAAAKREARGIVSAARAQSDIVREEAHKDGFDMGFREGALAGEEEGKEKAYQHAMNLFRKEQAQLMAAMSQAITDVDALKRRIRLDAERDVLELAIQIATKLTYAIGALDREAAKANLRRAIELVGTKSDLTIRVSARDHEVMHSFAHEVMDQARSLSAVELVADERMAPGGCTVRNERTTIDATLETQMNEVVSLLLQRGREDE